LEELILLKIVKVEDDLSWRYFFRVPGQIYRHDPLWTPLPEESQREMFNPRLNPLLRHVHCELFAAVDNERPVGRIAAITDDLLPDQEVGFFGCFETVNDPAVTRALLNCAAESLIRRGKTQMQGPVTINTTQQVGLLVKGFDLPPQLMVPYNPPYYKDLLEEAGCDKLLDLYSYLWRPENTTERHKLTAVARRAARIPGIRLRPVNLRDPWGEGKKLAAIHNLSMTDQWGFVPMDQELAAYYLAGLSSYADPEMLIFCEVGCEPVGVCLMMPDIGPRLRAARIGGPVLSFFFRPRSMRVGILGVVPEYRCRGVVALLIEKAIKTAVRKGYRQGELSLIMDRNQQMNSIITSAVGSQVYKTFRIYQKNLYTETTRPIKWKKM